MILYGREVERSKVVIVAVMILALISLIVAAAFYRKQKETDDVAVVEATLSPTVSPTVTPVPEATPLQEPSIIPSPTSEVTPSPSATPVSGTLTPRQEAEAAYQAKDYSKAIEQYKLAIEGQSNPTELATLWNLLGNSYRENVKPDDALKSYDQAISFNKQLGDAYLNKAAILWGQDQQDAAKGVLQTALDAKSTRESDIRNLLSVYEVRSR
ncbi:MAG: hypothetical protein K0S20_20 [Patescibacteria group bacterium]|jgi:TolA-binding protein|nr:hypothetical protein [Patescibacteria group bacterium]